jgi:hypothetical protein
MSTFSEMHSLYAGTFTDADKRECLPVVKTIIDLANLTRKEGVFALEHAVSKPDTPFFLKKAVMLIVDATEPRLVQEILRNFIISSHYEGAELLKRIIMLEGSLSIQAGENPMIIGEKLLSLMGEQFYEEASAYIWPDQQTPNEIVNNYFADMETETYPEGTNLLEETFSRLNDRDLQIILRETNMLDFQLAFRGSSKKLQQRLYSNLSMRNGYIIVKNNIELPMPTTEQIINAQQKMLNQLTALRSRIPSETTSINHLRFESSMLTQEEMNSLLSAAAGETK